MLNLLLTANAAPTESSSLTVLLINLLPFVVIIAVFYFLLIRPENKRKKSMQKMLSELIIGDEVTTAGGIIGKVVNIKDDEITVETGADKVRIRFLRSAITHKKQTIKD